MNEKEDTVERLSCYARNAARTAPIPAIRRMVCSRRLSAGGITTDKQQPKLVRIQKKGQVTMPSQVRCNPGLRKGDRVVVAQTDDGILITLQEVIASRFLDGIGEALREQGLTLEDRIKLARNVRGAIVREQYELDQT